jgi:formate dehydrogenase major subunit
VIDKGLADIAFIKGRTEGYDQFKDSVSVMDVSGVSEITGVSKEKLLELYDLLARPDQKVIVLYNIDSLWEKSKHDLKAIGNLLMVTGRAGKPGNGVILLRDHANSQGLLDMGVDTRYLPGQARGDQGAVSEALSAAWGTDVQVIATPVDLKAQLEAEKIKALLIFGEDPLAATANLRLTGGVEFMLVVDHFMTATATEADIVLPASLPVETEGSFTACDRRVQKIGKIFEPGQGMENWQIVSVLAEKLDSPLSYTSVKDIATEIRTVIPAYGSMNGSPFWGGAALFEKGFLTVNGKARFSLLPIDLSPCNSEKKPYVASENYFNLNVKGRLME